MTSSVCCASQSSCGFAYSPLAAAGAVLTRMNSLPVSFVLVRNYSNAAASNAIENDPGRRARQAFPRYLQGPLAADVDRELLADPVHELLQRGREAVHRQHHRGAQAAGDLGGARGRTG